LAGPFRVTASATKNGTGHVNGTLTLPFKYGWVTQVTIDLTSGNGTQFGFDLFEGTNSGTLYTNDDVTGQIIEVASTARTFFNEREYFKWFQCDGDKKLYYDIYTTAGTGNQVFSLVVSGIGLG